MKFVERDGWMVGTVMLAGFGEAMKTAIRCVHSSWAEETRHVEQGQLMVIERCSECKIAARMKYRAAGTP